MFCRRTIEVQKDNLELAQTLISRQTLADFSQGSQLLSHATAQANKLLTEANEEREAMLERAAFEIWQRADAQFKRWESERQRMCDDLERYATSVVNQAINRLLDDTAEPKRLAALLRHLIAVQLPEVSATLLCHPLETEIVKRCFAHQRSTLWKLQPDETVEPQTLVLKTDEGDFRISWSSMLEALGQH
ncbi:MULTISPECIES: type III secretion system stator protein SctL [Pseudomonas]|uniref:Type III secretion system stator protein SctL n=1 Tax=Pseudomonas tritici TaxID=2745518 RepID=A0A8H9Z1G4_9PSED|nr:MULTISPECIES: type III secretion system stator protein SctL [Pseudomonas]MBP2874498.1 type III secretion system stator protein SctL [Pseudomonas sp. SWRI144]MBW8125480.1 type III secretion system stator protein SctL [Pseudomonas sp. LAP_36]MBW8136905.1 type III secretion system stator protein SctL [Pseudomonas sp. PAMC 26818]QXH84805.1 type III secretion system stator protein SctL [Pseudomonas tritici]CRL96870.1 type III secretion apparatus protein, HrpE/YscL family [Pseudomonas sp. 24 E 1]